MGIFWRKPETIEINHRREQGGWRVKGINMQRRRWSLERRIYRKIGLHKLVICQCDGTDRAVKQCLRDIFEMEVELKSELDLAFEADQEAEAIPITEMQSGGKVLPFRSRNKVQQEAAEEFETPSYDEGRSELLYARTECQERADKCIRRLFIDV